MQELFCLVEEELPIGVHGWKRVSVRFDQWASWNGRPARDVKALELKFKGVRLFFFSYSGPF